MQEAETINGLGIRQRGDGVAIFVARPMSDYAYLDEDEIDELIEILETLP